MGLTFLILGCGWIGEAFAKKMQQRGHRVYASTTQEHKCRRLRDEGIYALMIDFENSINRTDLPSSFDYVLTSIPAVRNLDPRTVQQRFKHVLSLLQSITFKKNIFLSSVGVYPDVSGEFTEEFVITDPSNLLTAEHFMLKDSRTIIYRLGGLFGQNRIFAKYFQDKPCSTGYQKANFIHQSDVIELLYLGFTSDLEMSLYNVVCPEHPSKRDVIYASANKYGFNLPSSFDNVDGFQKVVLGERITQELQYTYLFPNPVLF